MTSTNINSERARLYQQIADSLIEPPSPDWFRLALRDLRAHSCPVELRHAHAALERAFEMGARGELSGDRRAVKLASTPRRPDRRSLIVHVLSILHLARLADDCCQANTPSHLDALNRHQSEFLRQQASQRLFQVASDMQEDDAPFYACLGLTLLELLRHDLAALAA